MTEAMTEAKEWFDRVTDEQNELCAKIKKLKEALESKEFADSVGEKNVILLKGQICYMIRYALFLDTRLERAGKERLLYSYVPQPDIDRILDYYPSEVERHRKEHDFVIMGEKEKEKKAIDLGLSVLWAEENLGADKDNRFGVKYAMRTDVSAISDTTQTVQYVYDKIDEVTRKEYGEGWRLPTCMELVELCNSCEWVWRAERGAEGYDVTGKNGGRIFLPTDHVRGPLDIYSPSGMRGDYWSGTYTGIIEVWALVTDGGRNEHYVTERPSSCLNYVRLVKDR